METAIIAAIPSIISGISSLISYIQTVRTAAQQAQAWTADMEAQYQAMLVSATTAPEWQPDPVITSSAAAPNSAPAGIPLIINSPLINTVTQPPLSSPLTSSK